VKEEAKGAPVIPIRIDNCPLRRRRQVS